MASSTANRPAFSVVVPFYNEEESIEAVCAELRDVLGSSLDIPWEVVMVDDGSRDRTPELADTIAAGDSRFRAIHLVPNSGQSAAFEAGCRAARAPIVGTMDGDGQNDPADFAKLLKEMQQLRVDMMCGYRQRRADNFVRRASSRIANRIRAAVLEDNIRDVGCSIRVFRRCCILKIPFFRNAHRYIPALYQMRGFSVAEMPVNHRAREKGSSKYGGGINSRLWVGIADLCGVWWLRKRRLRYRVRSAK